MIEAKALEKCYGPTVAVDGVSFSVARGEIVGLLGPNGAGKSTTIRMMTTYLVPNSGSIRIGEIDVEEDPIAVRRLLGYMPEAAALYTDMRVLDYLRYIAQIRQISRAKINERIGWSADRCGLHDVLLKTIGSLSKGNKQRVALAQAILHDPEILVLDEPTSGLDPNQIRAIRSFIQELGQEKTVFLSTHILQEVNAVCNRAIVINRGRVVADGSLEQLREEASREGTYTVSYDGPAAEVAAALQGVSGVQSVDALEANGYARFRVHGDPEADLRRPLYELATGKGWTLGELAPERLTIEQVFHHLTEGA